MRQSGAFDNFYQQWRGVPYRMGGTSRAGLDCSAFTQLAYSQVLGFTLPRTTESQASLGRPVDRYRLSSTGTWSSSRPAGSSTTSGSTPGQVSSSTPPPARA